MSSAQHTSASRFGVRPLDGQPRVRSGGGRRGWLVFAILVLLGLGGTAVALTSSRGGPQQDKNIIFTNVEQGTLSVEVTDRGNLESASNIEHRCEVESKSGGGGIGGGTTVLWIIEEGKTVKKDEMLVELDASNLEDLEKTQRIAYEIARSTYEKARAEEETARKTIKEHVEGIFIQEEKTRKADLTVEEENLNRAKESLKHTEVLYHRGFATKEELDAAKFAVISATLNLEKAQLALKVYLEVTMDRTLTQLTGDVESKAAVRAAEETKVKQEKARLDKVVVQLTKCKIFAKADGMVVYYKPAQRWGAQEEQLKEGAAVRERQQLIVLPDLKQMQVRMLVHESKINWIKQGQIARMRVDAFADKVLEGEVISVATAPEQGPWFDQDKRSYPVTVKITTPIDGLKPGMTTETTILVSRLTDVLTVPVQCVRTVGKKTFCYVKGPGGAAPVERTVKLGRSNDKKVEVVEGLAAGDEIVESPVEALKLAERIDAAGEEESQFGADVVTAKTDATTAAAPAEKKDEAKPAEKAAEPKTGATAQVEPKPAAETAKPQETAAAPDKPAAAGADAKAAADAKRRNPTDLLQYDADKDGKVSEDEAPEQMRPFFSKVDTGGDGYIDKAEWAVALRAMQQMQRQQQGAGGVGAGAPQ